MRLNFDILAAVLPWIKTRRDVLSFISTCSDLYNTGVRCLLKFPCNVTSERLPQFYRLLQAKSGFLALRDLCVSSDDLLGSDAVDQLKDILNRAKNLHRIQIIDEVMLSSLVLYDALASLPSLRYLDLQLARSDQLAELMMLEQLQSPLATLKLGEMAIPLDLVATLANFQRTLEELHLEEATIFYNSTTLCCANLTSLHLTCVANFRLSVFIPAFPNLRTLSYEFSGSERGDGTEELRDNNIQFQTAHPTQCWHLMSLSGDIGSLYTLGLQSKVPHVSITSPRLRSDPAGPCLSPLRPLQLSVVNNMNRVVGDWLFDTVPEDWNELVRLDLSFQFFADDTSFVDHEACLDELLEELGLLVSESEFRLFFLVLEMRGERGVDLPNSAYTFLDTIKMETLATRVLQTVPTLKTVRFVVDSAEKRVSNWAYSEDGKCTSILSENEAKCIVDRVMSPLLQAYHDS
ncbi:hypothetical protein EIP86_006999 [Pleurotus ostreatoroseus]|nr:hypothetical protein EIP86_006999 [Pleurotus ostreatoroseus]